MNNENTKRELVVLLAHFIKNKQPEVYQKFADYCDENKLYPPSCTSIDDAMNLRFSDFPQDQFYHFIKSLLPKDDYPSIFRRMQPFPQPIPNLPFKSINPIKRVFCHYESIYCLAMDPLGRILATGSDDYQIKLWKLPDLDPICTLSGHENCITNICFNPLCTYLLSSSHDKTIKIWSLTDGTCTATLADFTNDIVHFAVFSPSGSMIAGACEDGSIPMWITCDAFQSSAPCRVIPTIGKRPAAWVAFSPGGEFLSYTCEPSEVVVVALKTMTAYSLELHSSLVGLTSFFSSYYISGTDFAPRLITASNEEGTAAIWEMENYQYKPKYTFKQTGSARRSKIQCLAWDADEHLLVLAKSNGVFVFDMITGESLHTLPHSSAFDDCACIAANPVYREVFFFGNSSGFVAIADVSRNEILTEMKCGDDIRFLDAVWSKDGQWVFACDNAGSISTFYTFGHDDVIRKTLPSFTLTELFTDEKNPNLFVDHDDKPLPIQPRKYDIRNLNLSLMTLQTPYLRNCAIELALIQKITAPDRQVMTTPTSNTIGPPPLHIRITTEYPVNPRGNELLTENGDEEEEEEEDTNEADGNGVIIKRKRSKPKRENGISTKIVSDTDDWMFVDKDEFDESFKENQKIDDNEEFEFETTPLLLSEDIPSGFWPNYACTIACDDNMFIPQVGDEVVFIWSAYQKLLSEDEKASFKLPEISRCTIQEYRCTEFGMELKLSTPATTGWVTVDFPIPEEVTFLIPLNKFKFAKRIGKTLNVNDKVVVPFVSEDGDITPYHGTIQSINPKWKNSPFESIVVDWGNGEPTNISPWEIAMHNGREIKYVDTSVRIDGVEKGMIGALNAIIADQRYTLFQHCPNPETFADYNKFVTSPMSLQFILERLENGYYRTIDSISADIQLLYTNSVLYNDSNSHITTQAKELQSNLKRTLDGLAKQFKDKRTTK